MSEQPNLRAIDPASEELDLQGPIIKTDRSLLKVDQHHDQLEIHESEKPITLRKWRDGEEWFRVKSDKESWGTYALLDYKADKKIYIVPPSFISLKPAKIKLYRLYTCVNFEDETFIVWAQLPDKGVLPPWAKVKHNACMIAMNEWVQATWDTTLNDYTRENCNFTKDPKFTTRTLDDIVTNTLFNTYGIENTDHEVMRKLLGFGGSQK